MNQSITGPELCCLVYLSTAAADLTQNDLTEILAISKTRNASASLTGLLLYSGAHFIQVLEGSADTVAEVFENRISADSRHSKIVVLVHERMENRSFANWTMALKTIKPSELTGIPGFADYETVDGLVPASPPINTRVRKLLDTFRLAA